MKAVTPLRNVVTSRRFERGYLVACNPKLKRTIQTKVWELATTFELDPSLASRKNDRVAYLNNRVIEYDVDRRWRIICASNGGKLHLLTVGDHDLIPKRQYTKRMMNEDLGGEQVPVARCFAQSLQIQPDGDEWLTLDDAFAEKWIYQLGVEQQKCVLDILDFLANPRQPKIYTRLIVGGPGTGKTSILLQIADLLQWEPTEVNLWLSDSVKEYVSEVLGACVLGCSCDLDSLTGGTVLLVDDPGDWDTIEQTYTRAAEADVRLLVIATDLSQLSKLSSDDDVRDFCRKSNAQVITLKQCYRQLAAVGKQAKKVLETITTKFSKYARSDRIEEFSAARQLTHDSMNDLQFKYAGGYAKVYDPVHNGEIAQEFKRLRAMRLWEHWCPILIVHEESIDPVKAIGRANLKGLRCHYVTLDNAEAVRGVEYQIVVFLLTDSMWHRLCYDGEYGMKTAEYLRVRSYRIPFTRATDRMIIFSFAP